MQKTAKPLLRFRRFYYCYMIEKMMDASVPSIIIIATIRLKILKPLLIVSLPYL